MVPEALEHFMDVYPTLAFTIFIVAFGILWGGILIAFEWFRCPSICPPPAQQVQELERMLQL